MRAFKSIGLAGMTVLFLAPLGAVQSRKAIDRPHTAAALADSSEEVQAASLPWHFQIQAQTGGPAGPIALAGNLAYVGRGPQVAVADLSDPAHPRWLGQSEMLAGTVTQLALGKGHLYALVGEDGEDEDLVVLSLATPTAPLAVGGWDLDHSAASMAVAGDTCWLSLTDGDKQPPSRMRIVSLALDDPERPQVVGQMPVPPVDDGRGTTQLHSVHALGSLVIVAQDGYDDTWVGMDLRSLRVLSDGRLAWQSRVSFGNQTFVAVSMDPELRRVYAITSGYYADELSIADIGLDGVLEQRGSLRLPQPVKRDCRGTVAIHGRWLIYASGCLGTPPAVFDVLNPDQPEWIGGRGHDMPMVEIRAEDDRLVASGGGLGWLRVLDPSALPDLKTLGEASVLPSFRGVIDSPNGRYGVADGQGIVRVDSAAANLLGPTELALALPRIRHLASGPEGMLVATEATDRFGNSSALLLISPEPAGLRVVDRSVMENFAVAELRVVGDDIYVGGRWSEGLQRWGIDPSGLSRLAVSAVHINTACFAIGDQLYFREDQTLALLDRLSLILLKTLIHRESAGCGIAVRPRPGDRGGPPDIVQSAPDEIYSLRDGQDGLTAVSRVRFPSIGADQEIMDLDGQYLVLGKNGISLVAAPAIGVWQAKAHLRLASPLGVVPVDPGPRSMALGVPWLVSTAGQGMLRVAALKGSPPATPTDAPVIAGPTLGAALAEPMQTPESPRGTQAVFLPYAGRGAIRPTQRPPFVSVDDSRNLGWRFGSLAADRAGARLWAADGYGIVGLDLATDGLEQVARSQELPAPLRDMVLAGEWLVATGFDQRLYVLSRPAVGDPVRLGSLALPDASEAMVARGNLVYVATSRGGVLTIDLSRPAWPRIIHRLGSLLPSHQLEAFDGGLLFVGTGEFGSHEAALISLADPRAPSWGPDLPDELRRGSHFAACGRRLYASNSSLFVRAGSIAPDWQVTAMSDWSAAFDALQPPVRTDYLEGMVCEGRRLVLTSAYLLAAVDMDAEGYPAGAALWSPPWKLGPGKVIVADGHAYAPFSKSIRGTPDLGAGLLAVDLNTLSAGPDRPPRHSVHAAMADVRAMQRIGHVLYMGADAAYDNLTARPPWLAIDMRDPARPVRLGHVDALSGVERLIDAGPGRALAITWNPADQPKALLRSLDMSDPLRPRVLEQIALPDLWPYDAVREGDRLLIALRSPDSGNPVPAPGAFVAVDLTSGSPMRILGTLPLPEALVRCSIFLDGDRAYVSESMPSGRTWVVDLKNTPRLLGQLPFAAWNLKRSGDHIFARVTATGGIGVGGLATLRLDDAPEASEILGKIDFLNMGLGLQIVPLPDGRHIVHGSLTYGLSGLRILQVDTSGRPHWEDGELGAGWVQPGAMDQASLELVDGWLAYMVGPDNRPGTVGLRLLRLPAVDGGVVGGGLP